MDHLPANISCNLHLESSITVSFLSFLTFALLCILLIFYSYGDDHIYLLNNPGNLIVLFLGILINIIATTTIPYNDMHIYSFYTASMLLLVGIITIILGSRAFFKAPTNENEKPLGYHHSNISLLIWVITIPLVLLELFQTIGALTVKVDYYKAAIFIIALIQKLLQANIYHFDLRHKIAREDRRQGASFYLKVLSLFNFVMWLDSIVTAEGGIEFVADLFGGGRGLGILGEAMNALLIDYRLLCCLLFAEHALEIDSPHEEEEHHGGGDDEEPVDDSIPIREFRIKSSQMNGLGYIVGFLVIGLQLICGLQYLEMVTSWSNIFPIVADVFVVVLGFMLLNIAGRLRDPSSQDAGTWRETNSKGVDVMVAMMGITGFLFWIIMSIFSATWASTIHNLKPEYLNLLKWNCAKNFLRSLGILFQLYFFMKSDPYIGCSNRMRRNKWSFFILPALMLSLLAVFIMAVIDSHTKIVEMLIHKSGINHVMMTLLKAGEPIYLGFCLHLFLHFFIISNNMKDQQLTTTNRARRGSILSRPRTPFQIRRSSSQPANLHRDTNVDFIDKFNVTVNKSRILKKIEEKDPLLEPLIS